MATISGKENCNPLTMSVMGVVMRSGLVYQKVSIFGVRKKLCPQIIFFEIL